ncbi:MAG: leucine-rich repeat domain-containing protein [Eubacteriales bacterium]|nr:leucine-rich repeat domain-containing protein [Eubacteriales bacterium]
MKRFAAIILVVATLITTLLCLTSCDEEDITKELKFELLDDDTYSVVGYTGDETDILIPAEYDGKAVTEIGGEAFRQSKLTKVTIPSSVKSIGYNAFYRSESLQTVVLGEGLEIINMSAFYGCTNLKTINIPESVKQICRDAFQACSSLESITIPVGIEDAFPRMFMGCSNLSTVTIENEKYADAQNADDCGYIFKYAKTVYIKDGVAIGSYITNNFAKQDSDRAGYSKYTR